MGTSSFYFMMGKNHKLVPKIAGCCDLNDDYLILRGTMGGPKSLFYYVHIFFTYFI